MDPKRELAIALVLQFLALLLVSGTQLLVTRALQLPANSNEISTIIRILITAAVGVGLSTTPALILLGRVLVRGAGRERALAATAFLVGLMQLAAASVVLWDCM
jgi:hypothetical protein